MKVETELEPFYANLKLVKMFLLLQFVKEILSLVYT